MSKSRSILIYKAIMGLALMGSVSGWYWFFQYLLHLKRQAQIQFTHLEMKWGFVLKQQQQQKQMMSQDRFEADWGSVL